MKNTSLHALLQERIVLLDGGMGTALQAYDLTEDDYLQRIVWSPCSQST